MKPLHALKQNELVCTVVHDQPWEIVKVFEPLGLRGQANLGRLYYHKGQSDTLFYELHELDNTNKEIVDIWVHLDGGWSLNGTVTQQLTQLEMCWCRGRGWKISKQSKTLTCYPSRAKFLLDDYLKEIHVKVNDAVWQYASGEIPELIFLSTRS